MSITIDLKELQLLSKYIQWVVDYEGTDLIPKNVNEGINGDHCFTEDELKILWAASGWDEEKQEYVS